MKYLAQFNSSINLMIKGRKLVFNYKVIKLIIINT